MEFFAKIAAGSKRRCHVRWFQVSDARFQVSGSRCAGSMCQVPSVRFQVPGVRGQVRGVRSQVPCATRQVSGIIQPGTMCLISGIRSQVKMSKTFTLKIFYVLTEITNFFYFSVEITILQTHFSIFFSTFRKNKEKNKGTCNVLSGIFLDFWPQMRQS